MTEYIEFYSEQSFYDEEYYKDFYIEQYTETISTDNCNMQVPMFLDKKGKIAIVARIYNLGAGATSYLHIVNTGL